MKFLIPFLIGSLAALLQADDRLVRETEPLSPEEELSALQVADGFQIKLFASEPMINKPINLAIDEKGRVWVSSTVEYPYAADPERWSDEIGTRVRDSRDAIKILEDTDGDGKADKATDFADGLNIPTGVLPWHRAKHPLGCIAWSIPNIWYFADTTGDGKCDHREVLFGPLGYEKDTHGMCSSFRYRDGWVYATHGFNNTSHLQAKDGSEIELHSGNVFRFRPDGSHVEVWSRGQVNPFGLCFDHRGNLYSADCHSAPIYQLIRGAYYPSFGKPHDGLGFGPAMIEHSHGSTGISGIVYVDRNRWGPEWDDHILIGNPVTSRVNLDRIKFAGSTPQAEEKPDFIVSDDPWFRPVDLALGGGALYVADFYNRIIGHYEVPLDHPGRDRERGRIWRVTPQKENTLSEVEKSGSDTTKNPIASLQLDSPFARRKAAAALQENPEIDALPALRKALKETPDYDTHLRHALRIALREILSLPDSMSELNPNIEPDLADILLAVKTPDAANWLAKLPVAELNAHPATFASARRKHVGTYASEDALTLSLQDERANAKELAIYRQARIIDDFSSGIEERSDALQSPIINDWAQNLALRLLDEEKDEKPAWQSRPHPMNSQSPSPWIIQKRKTSAGEEVKILSSLRRGEKQAEQRTGVLRSRSFSAPEQVSFLICGHRGHPSYDAHEKTFVRAILEESGDEIARTYPLRSDVAQRVEWNLSDHKGQEIQIEIVDGDKGPSFAWLGVGKIEGANLPVEAFREAEARETALQKLASVLRISAPANLRDRLRPYLPTPPPAPAHEISDEERSRVEELIQNRLSSFDAANASQKTGEQLFRTHCSACHQIEKTGGLIGPQLDGIGVRGAERIAEDILDPNRNVDAHFRMISLKLNDGTTTGGFLRSETTRVFRIVDAAGASHRIAKDSVENTEVTAISIMPANFGDLLGEKEFHDLLAWLIQQR